MKMGKNIKVIPENIGDLLTPIALAFWLSGEGYFEKIRSYQNFP